METTSLYLHIPFCQSKCHYCDFAVRVLHHPEQITRYLSYLCQEIQALPVCGLRTLYLGGGTPALLTGQQMAQIFEVLGQKIALSSLGEITLEVNPDQLNPKDFADFRELGINRISLGAQSFDAQVLKTAGRSHSPEQIQQAFEALRSWGFDNISLDIIYGLPGQEQDSWQNTLEACLSLRPEHLSLYALEVHEQTAFGHQDANSQLDLPEIEVWAYHTACEMLTGAGYCHYEIANFALPGRESRHNLVYWQNQPFLAAGVGAHGYWQNRRYGNPKNLRQYYQQVDNQAWGWLNTPPQTLVATIEETVFLGLRLLQDGLDLKAFEARFGENLEVYYPKVLPRLLAEGWLEKRQGCLFLTPQAVLVSNEVFVQFLEPVL